MLPAGAVLRNRYRVARLLGRGGMGAVYRAWDLSLNIPVALKEMVPPPGAAPALRAQWRIQFQQEARVLAVLSHPHLPRVTNYFEEKGNAYLVMDYVEGENLEQCICRFGALPEEQVARWAVQLLDALAVCHERRIVHRDIKPQNVIIRPTGEAVLVDFGLVKLWDPRDPRTRSIVRGMGTYEFASPEHFYLGNRHTEPRSDLYSLSATLYYALSGRQPPSALDRWAQHVPLLPLRQVGARVRPQFESVLMRGLELDPNRRWVGARQMQQAVQMATGVSLASLPQVVPVSPWRAAGSPIVKPAPASTFPMGASIPRDTRWPLEMATGMGMALIGVLVINILLFAPWMTPALYAGRSISALLLGALGWFIGDLIFQAMARPEQIAAAPSHRPTQRLVSLTRQLVRRLSLAQQIGLLALLLIGTAFLVWVLAPPISRIPFVVNNVSLYAPIAPLA